MTTFARPRRALLKLAMMTVLATATILPAAAAVAAPPHGPHFQLGDGGRQRFNLDPGRCGMPGPGFRNGGGRGDCPAPDRRYQRDDRGGRGDRHGPGSNAFGLQFDWQGY